MSDFWLYLTFGFQHVLDVQAYDHVLFFIVLVASYQFSDWKRLITLVSVFTIGHTLSLLLASYQVIQVSAKLVEFLIPITILFTAIYNIIVARKTRHSEKKFFMVLLTLFFGIIHGFGFATYFGMIKDGDTLVPLLEFALGIEAAQIIVVFAVMILAFIFRSFLRFNQRDWVMVISAIVIGLIIPMLIENWAF